MTSEEGGGDQTGDCLLLILLILEYGRRRSTLAMVKIPQIPCLLQPEMVDAKLRAILIRDRCL